MRRLHLSARRLGAAVLALLPAAALAQSMNMDDMPGMSMHSHDAHAGHDKVESAQTTKAVTDHGDDADHQGMDHAAHVMASGSDQKLPSNGHIPPAPPQHVMPEMSPEQMTTLMQMDDAAPIGMLLFDRLERSRSTRGEYATHWEMEGWWGNAINRVWLKTEGERGREGTQDGRVDVLWSTAWTSFWDWQLGARQDIGQGPKRQWAALGVQGVAPYWFDTQATFYLGERGRTALRLETSYELLFTQRLILEPKLEMNFYGKDDPQRGISSGLADMEAGLRLRYEFSRKFAPYIGVNWTRRFGTTSPAAGEPAQHARETTWLAGVRLWF